MILTNNILKFVSPVNGKTISLSKVPDPVFAQKMAGEGVAIMSEDDVIVAPVDGEIGLIFNTRHAFTMTLDNGAAKNQVGLKLHLIFYFISTLDKIFSY
ncbi:PTS glucose transporter subunit IIA [Clostridium sp. DJ247]|nr:PTS glucose transporter subunit IIA [Clostridium sp. DJ247]